jgi:hypothetical protein
MVVHTQDWLKAKPDEPPVEREIVILTCQRFWSQIEAIVKASGDLTKQMCM